MPEFVLVSFLDANYTYGGSIQEFLYLLIPSPESLMLPPMNLTHTQPVTLPSTMPQVGWGGPCDSSPGSAAALEI